MKDKNKGVDCLKPDINSATIETAERIKTDLSKLGIEHKIGICEDCICIEIDPESVDKFGFSSDIYEGTHIFVSSIFYQQLAEIAEKQIESLLNEAGAVFKWIHNIRFLKVIEVNGQRYSGRVVDLLCEIQSQFQPVTAQSNFKP